MGGAGDCRQISISPKSSLAACITPDIVAALLPMARWPFTPAADTGDELWHGCPPPETAAHTLMGAQTLRRALGRPRGRPDEGVAKQKTWRGERLRAGRGRGPEAEGEGAGVARGVRWGRGGQAGGGSAEWKKGYLRDPLGKWSLALRKKKSVEVGEGRGGERHARASERTLVVAKLRCASG